MSIAVRGRWHTPPVEGVRFSTHEIGCKDASFRVLDSAWSEQLADDCEVRISHPRTGQVLWTGCVDGEGLRRAEGGLMDVSCRGNVSKLYQQRRSLPYLVRGVEGWQDENLRYGTTTNVQAGTGQRPQDPPYDAVFVRIPRGVSAYPSLTQGRVMWVGHQGTDMHVGGFRGFRDCGTGFSVSPSNPADWRIRLWVGDQFYGAKPFESNASVTTSTEIVRRAGVSAGWSLPPAGSDPSGDDWNVLTLTLSYEPPAGSTGWENRSEQLWMAWHGLAVSGVRLDKNGQPYASPATSVLASEIAADLVGRLPSIIDPDASFLPTSDFPMSTADWRDADSVGAILDDLLLVHSDWMWQLRRTGPDGRAGLAFMPRPTTPRYVLPATSTSLDLVGSSDSLADRVTVTWVDWKGRRRSRQLVASKAEYPDVAEMTQPVEADDVDLGSSLESSISTPTAAMAERVGRQVLDRVARKRRSGTARVTGPVLDLEAGRWVEPSEMEAGCVASLEATGERLWVQSVDVDGLWAADVALGDPRRTVDQIVAARGRRARR